MRKALQGLALLPLALLAACGPMPVDQAMRDCIEPARLAQAPRGEIGIRVDGEGNVGTRLSIGVSSDYLQGRDPDQVFAQCVQNRSGQPPLYPFSSMPESRL
jgi:hypothetical protein